jgi:hypothetical protein
LSSFGQPEARIKPLDRAALGDSFASLTNLYIRAIMAEKNVGSSGSVVKTVFFDTLWQY